MWKQLDKLRQKPDEQKKVIALIVAFCIVAVITITWGTMSFYSSGIDKEEKNNVDNLSQTASPLDSIKSQFNIIKEEIRDVKDVIGE